MSNPLLKSLNFAFSDRIDYFSISLNLADKIVRWKNECPQFDINSIGILTFDLPSPVH
jgi:hypothetical protein